jgi:hypothetical protein
VANSRHVEDLLSSSSLTLHLFSLPTWQEEDLEPGLASLTSLVDLSITFSKTRQQYDGYGGSDNESDEGDPDDPGDDGGDAGRHDLCQPAGIS